MVELDVNECLQWAFIILLVGFDIVLCILFCDCCGLCGEEETLRKLKKDMEKLQKQDPGLD